MLLILIPIAWLAVLTIVVAVCRATARGEAGGAQGEGHVHHVREGLVVWDRDSAIALRHSRSRSKSAGRERRPERGRRAAHAERVAAHGAR
jgi:hypothetical protein